MIEQPPVLTVQRGFPRPTQEQLAAFAGVSTGFVCGAMEGDGALDASIRPIGDGRDIDCAVAGTAVVADNGPEEMLATFAALHLVRPGDVVVAAVDGYQGCAAAGDQFMGMLRNAGGVGLITDGPMRDYDGIVEVGLPVWCTGLNPNSPYINGPGRAGGAAVVGGRQVRSGDLVVADRNGVVVVPHEQIDAVIARLEVVRTKEAELEAKVADGLCLALDLGAMVADGRAVVVGPEV